MTYDDLVAAISAIVTIPSTDANLEPYLPRIVEGAELRCYRDLDPFGCRTQLTQTVAGGFSVVAPPNDMVAIRQIALTLGTVTITPFEQRDYSFIAEYAPDTSISGPPRYWSLTTPARIDLAPTTDQEYELTFTYTQRPTPLSAQNETTWLSLHYPDMLRFAAFVEASGYIKNFGQQADDPKMAMSWEQMYQTALVSARAEESRRKLEPAFDAGSPTPQKASNAPVS